MTDEKWLFILNRDGWRCRYCSVTLVDHGSMRPEPDDQATVDHVVPRSMRGSNHESNLVAACRKCNCAKGNRLLAGHSYPEGARPPTLAEVMPAWLREAFFGETT
jgi:5-methylcytosine-specific restriction endonuclease McrA